MLQTVDGREVFVVDFDTMPELPITWSPGFQPYALALEAAIQEKLITEPGKYGIEIIHTADHDTYNIFTINE